MTQHVGSTPLDFLRAERALGVPERQAPGEASMAGLDILAAILVDQLQRLQ